MSGTIYDYYPLDENNHYKRMQKCSKIKSRKKLLKYLKTTDANILAACHATDSYGKMLLTMEWVPTIENPSTKGAFITQRADDIYNSADAPVMDTLFSFTSQVNLFLILTMSLYSYKNYFNIF